MKKILMLLVMLILSISVSSKGLKYQPKTKEELQELIENESIYLGDIDTSAITDMSYLFIREKNKKDRLKVYLLNIFLKMGILLESCLNYFYYCYYNLKIQIYIFF